MSEIKLKNIKTCCHCSAYVDSYCRLGYETERVSIEQAKIWRHFTTWEDAVIRLRPIEKCPKPKNIKEVLRLTNLLDVHRNHRPSPNDIQMTEAESLYHYINMNPDK